MIIEKLNAIQTRLVATKDQTNEFGKFKYRTAEGILEAVKPLLDGCAITLTDELVEIGGAIHIKATATLWDGTESVSSSAYAQQDTHKGMSAEQSSGTASSYARKYAVCGLLAVDGSTDVDSLDNRPTCEVCGNPIQDGKRTNGEVWKAEDIAEYTKRKYGKSMCSDCAKKESKK